MGNVREARLARALTELFQPVQQGVLVVAVPSFGGSFEFDCRSDLLQRILVHGGYEPKVVNLLKKKIDVNRDVIDVGANVGLFTVLLSGLIAPSARVLAIEPTPSAAALLNRNLRRNNCNRNVIVFEGAASSSKGTITLKVIAGKEEYSSARDLVHPSVRRHPFDLVNVETDTIDALVEKSSLRPGFIKIDTEGAEHDVLLGCAATLSKHRPIVLCECWDNELLIRSGQNPSAVPDFFHSQGYLVSRPIKDEIFAIPEERVVERRN